MILTQRSTREYTITLGCGFMGAIESSITYLLIDFDTMIFFVLGTIANKMRQYAPSYHLVAHEIIIDFTDQAKWVFATAVSAAAI